MRDDSLNFHDYPVRTEMTAIQHIPTSHVCSTGESKLKYSPVDVTLLQICSTDEEESKCIIVEKCSTKDDEYESKGIIVEKYYTDDYKS